MIRNRPSILIACCILSIPYIATANPDAPRLIPATPENTTLEGGVALELVAERPEHPHQFTRDSHSPKIPHRWHWWETAGGGVFATTGAEGSDAPVLRTLITGLQPNSIYQVDGFFRAEAGKQPPQTVRGDIRMGLTIARTEAFGPVSRQGLSCIIGEDHKSKRVTRHQPQNQTAQPADHPNFPLFRVSLGTARSDAQGTIIVFIDDQPNDTLSAATLYEGVAVSPALEGEEPVAGGGSPQALVEAVRVNDRETMERELAAGANLNTPDRESLTALFYACLAGDHDLVTRFLKAGAKPDAPNQRLTPLWAATRNAEVEIVNELLDAGAEVDITCAARLQIGSFLRFKGPGLINPVRAAVQSGCVKTLEALLAKNPSIDIGKAVFGPKYELTKSTKKILPAAREDLITYSMDMRNFEMAAWMIRNGHNLNIRETPRLPVPPGTQPEQMIGPRSVMIRAIIHSPPMLDVVNALQERGVPLIYKDNVYRSLFWQPWDALSAAAFDGNAELVRRWLPLASDLPQWYTYRLLTMAGATGCVDTLTAVSDAFPNIPSGNFKENKEEIIAQRERLAGDSSSFTPRTIRPTEERGFGGTLRIAVIGTGAGAGPADSFAANASTFENIEVVDRGELATAIAERSLTAARPIDPSQLSNIGDFLKADVIVTAASFGENNDSVLRFEAHEVRTGLTVHRAFQQAKVFQPETFAQDFLTFLSAKLDASTGRSLTAITLLGIAAERESFRGASLAPTLHNGLLQEIDATPGLVALTRDQLTPIVSEQALGKEGGLWGAAWTIEGGIRESQTQDLITLALRARSVSDDSIIHDIAVDGPSTAPRELVLKAWVDLRKAILSAPAEPADDPSRAERESARLAREAEWLLKSPLAWQAAPLADAALYLGGDRLDRLMLRLRCHWATSHLKRILHKPWEEERNSLDIDDVGYPLSLHDHYLHQLWLDEQLELLYLTKATVAQVTSLLKDHPRKGDAVENELWQYIWRITEYRCRLVPHLLDSEQKLLLENFDAELRGLWEIIESCPEFFRNHQAASLLQAQRTTMNFGKLPWLGDHLAGSLLELATRPVTPWWDSLGIRPEVIWFEKFIYPSQDTLATFLKNNLANSAPNHAMRVAEISALETHGPDRIQKAKAAAAAWAATLASRLSPPSQLIHPESMASWHASHGLGIRASLRSPFQMPLPSLVAAPRKCVDMVYRAGSYHVARQNLSRASRKSSEWQQVAKRLTDDFSKEIPHLVDQKTPAIGFDLLIHAARENDELFGTMIADAIEGHLRGIRAMQPAETTETFGKNGEFRFVRHPESIQPSVLTDLRGISPKGHPVISFARIDPKHSHLLWLALHILPEPELALHGPIINDWSDPRVGVGSVEPWLVAIDCRDGSVAHQVNLAQTVLPGAAVNVRREARIGRFMTTGIAFSDNQLMVLFGWETDEFDDRRRFVQQLVTVDRTSGKAAVMPKLHRVVTSQLRENGGKAWPAMVGLGSDFYVLEETKHETFASRQNYFGHRALWKFTESGDATRLTEPGRRPAMSPFDADDMNPSLLRVDGDKILVASSWRDVAHYDPQAGAWIETATRPAAKWYQHVNQIDLREHHSWRFPFFRIAAGGKMIGATSLPDQLEPGTLVIQNNRDRIRVYVALTSPQDSGINFVVSPDFGSLTGNTTNNPRPVQKIALQEFEQSEMVRPILMNQTDDHLILGLRIVVYTHYMDTHEPVMLPVLWKISKQENLEILQTGTKR